MNDINQILLEGKIENLEFEVLLDGTYFVKMILEVSKKIHNRNGEEIKTTLFLVEFYGAKSYDYIKGRAKIGQRARVTAKLVQRGRDGFQNVGIIGEYVEL